MNKSTTRNIRRSFPNMSIKQRRVVHPDVMMPNSIKEAERTATSYTPKPAPAKEAAASAEPIRRPQKPTHKHRICGTRGSTDMRASWKTETHTSARQLRKIKRRLFLEAVGQQPPRATKSSLKASRSGKTSQTGKE